MVSTLIKIVIAGGILISLTNSAVHATEQKSCEIDGTCKAEYDDDKKEVCEDGHEHCAFWANKGECDTNPNYMTTNCMSSCGTCVSQSSTATTDNDGNEEGEVEVEDDSCADKDLHCASLIENGDCLINPKFMKTNCTFSCGFCVDEDLERNKDTDESAISQKRLYADMNLGEFQKLVGDEEDISATKTIIKKMERYAREIVATETFYPKHGDKCRNNNELCAFWASIGHCYDMAYFMTDMCPLACFVCDVRDKFDQCAVNRISRDLEKPPAVLPGAIKEFYDRLSDKKSFFIEDHEISPQFITEPRPASSGEGTSNHPLVARFDNFLTYGECNHFVQLGDDMGWEDPATDEFAVSVGIFTEPTSHGGMKSTCGQECEDDIFHEKVRNRISHLIGISSANLEPLELFKYKPVESKNASELHHNLKPHDNWLPAGPRALTFYLFLSDVKEGGGVGFPELDWLFIKPKKGSLLVWSNVLDEDTFKRDVRMVHENVPVVTGENIVASFHLHQYDWKKSFEEGCTV